MSSNSWLKKWFETVKTLGRGASKSSRTGSKSSLQLVLELLERREVPAALLTTDKDDYAPGSTATLFGSGFQTGESVRLEVAHIDTLYQNQYPAWEVTDGVTTSAYTDAAGMLHLPDLDGKIDGKFQTTWQVGQIPGSELEATATGLSSGLTAQTTFTDGDTLDLIVVGAQSGTVTAGIGGSVTYQVTVTRDNANNDFTTVLSATGLPSGVTVGSFSPSASLSFTTANEVQTVTLTLIIDTSAAAGTGIPFTVTASTGVDDPGDGLLTIAAQPAVNVSVSSDVSETGGNLVYTFTREATAGSNVTVNFALTGGATFGADYTGVATTSVVIPAGSTTASITLTPINDRLLEGTETAVLTLATGTGYSLGTSSVATGSILDDESATLNIDTAETMGEANGTGTVAVTLDITGTGTGTFALGSGVSISANVVDATGGSATSGADYSTFGTQTVTFNGGAADGDTRTVSVNVINDFLLEADETINLQMQALSAGSVSASLGTTASVVTIDDNESATLSIDTAHTVDEGLNQIVSVTLSITGSGSGSGTFALGSGVSISANVVDNEDGSATSTSDYDAFATQSVTFNGGAASGETRTVLVSTVEDTLLEPDETVILNLENLTKSAASVSASLGTTTSTITIDDNEAVTISLGGNANVGEGGSGSISVTMTITGTGSGTFSLPSGVSLSVNVVDGNVGTADSGADYTLSTQTITFDNEAASGSSQTVAYTTVNDFLLEGDETFKIALQGLSSNPSGIGSLGNSSATITIIDNEFASFSMDTTDSVTEQGGTQSVDVSLSIGGSGTGSGTFALGDGVSVSVEVANTGGTATSGSDYNYSLQTVTFSAGAESGDVESVSIAVINDKLLEGDETIQLSLQSPSASSGSISLSLGSGTTVTIVDNESATLDIASAYTVGEGSSQTVAVTLNITGTGTTSGSFALGSGVSISANIADTFTGTAASGSDYSSFGTQSITFNGGAASGDTRTKSLSTIDDHLLETDETVILSLQSLSAGSVSASIGNATSTITIDDNETANLSITTSSAVTEGGSAVVTVSLEITGSGTGTYSLPSGASLTANVVYSGGSSTADYLDVNNFGTKTVTFTGTNTSANLTLTTRQDVLLEGTETAILNLQNIVGSLGAVSYTIGNMTHTATIYDNETATFQLLPTSSVTEGGNIMAGVKMTITAVGTGVPRVDTGASVSVKVNDLGTGSASAGSDYDSSSQIVTFTGGDTTGTIRYAAFATVDDSLTEDNETVNLGLSCLNTNPASISASLISTTHTATIIENDQPLLKFTDKPDSVTAGQKQTIVVQLVKSDCSFIAKAGVTVKLKLSSGTFFYNGAQVSSVTLTTDATGKVTLKDFYITKAGSYYFEATGNNGGKNLDAAFSCDFQVYAAAWSKIVFTTQPPATISSGGTTTVVVQLKDQYGNDVNQYGVGVTLSMIKTSSHSGTPKINGLSSVTVTTNYLGQAVFSNITLTGPVSTYYLKAVAGTKTANSSGFEIV